MKLVSNHNQTVFVKANLFKVILIHVGAIGLGPLFFRWDAFWFGIGTALLFGYSLGIFFHMLLTHRAFKCKKWVENVGALLATLTARGPMAAPIRYVAMHKIHHAYSDTELDPHTPTKGKFFALLSWFWQMPLGFTKPEYYENYTPELKNDRWLRFLDRNVTQLQVAWGVLCFVIGGSVPLWSGGSFDPIIGISYVVYGVFVGTMFSYYIMNAVDVINHTIGYRAYETKDHSTNSFIMAAIHLGGAISWHNNHHAHQHYFTVRKNWWEFDVHYLFLRFLSLFGLVWDIEVLDETKNPKAQTVAPRIVRPVGATA